MINIIKILIMKLFNNNKIIQFRLNQTQIKMMMKIIYFEIIYKLIYN